MKKKWILETRRETQKRKKLTQNVQKQKEVQNPEERDLLGNLYTEEREGERREMVMEFGFLVNLEEKRSLNLWMIREQVPSFVGACSLKKEIEGPDGNIGGLSGLLWRKTIGVNSLKGRKCKSIFLLGE